MTVAGLVTVNVHAKHQRMAGTEGGSGRRPPMLCPCEHKYVHTGRAVNTADSSECARLALKQHAACKLTSIGSRVGGHSAPLRETKVGGGFSSLCSLKNAETSEKHAETAGCDFYSGDGTIAK